MALILALALIGAAEWVARLEFFQAKLTPPRMGSRHYQLGYKLALLDKAVENRGLVDCVVVGSSTVDLGFDPDSFRNGYQQETGKSIQCFNFGIDASTAASTAAIARIIIEDYRPRLLIFGTDARDYAVSPMETDPAVILDTDWVAYRQGNFSLAGWLLEHSYLYRYRQHLSRLLRFQFEDTLRSESSYPFETLSNGFTPFSKASTYINDPPDPRDDSFEVTYNTRIFSTFQMLEENLAALEQVLDQNGSGTQVVVVEMPVADGLYYFFGEGKDDYRRFIQKIQSLSEQAGAEFWTTETLDLIPNDGWVDYSHVNKDGAEALSTWLGRKIGALESQGVASGNER